MEAYYKKLEEIKKDPKQYEAFLTHQSTVVLAGPGSGKTTILTLKIMKLLQESIHPPQGLACITYSREAANEFKNRLKYFGLKTRKNIFLGTVHSFCISEILSPFAELYDYKIPSPIQIISEKDRKQLFEAVVNSLDLSDAKVTIEDMDRERNLDLNGISTVEIPSYEVALKVAKEYERRLRGRGKVDFVDIVKYSTLLIQEQEYVRKCLEAKFPWILIDEYQDLGRPLHEMVLSLFSQTDIKIFAVGDPDQSIYSFTGAIPDYLIELRENENFQAVQLIRNYRSPQAIIDASELALNTQQKRNYESGIQFNTEAEFHFKVCEIGMGDQYQKVATEIIPECRQAGIPLQEIAVLVKYRYEVDALASKLEKYNIPSYKAKFEFERSEVVIWLEKCASWVNNENGQSFMELSNFWIYLLGRHERRISIHDEVDVKQRLHDVLRSSALNSNKLSDWIKFVILELDIINLLKDSPFFPDENTNLRLLYRVAAKGEFSEFDLSRFSKLGKPDNQVTITTRHGSKGLEFKVVIILGLEEGNFPDYRSVDPKKLAEEHRVFFVCISRSKKACYLVRSKKVITRYGNQRDKSPSPFWDLIQKKYGSTE